MLEIFKKRLKKFFPFYKKRKSEEESLSNAVFQIDFVGSSESDTL